jgi:hypothetical protein
MRNPIMQNRGHFLGDLPTQNAIERGEAEPLAPFGFPPNGNEYMPPQVGGQGGNRAISQNQSQWGFIVFEAGTVAIKVQDFTARKFMLIQNKSPTATLYLGFGYEPNALNGLVLTPGSAYEPFTYPTNEIYVSSDEEGANGLLVFGV